MRRVPILLIVLLMLVGAAQATPVRLILDNSGIPPATPAPGAATTTTTAMVASTATSTSTTSRVMSASAGTTVVVEPNCNGVRPCVDDPVAGERGDNGTVPDGSGHLVQAKPSQKIGGE